MEIRIDKLYIELIIGFINKKKFSDFEYIYDVLIKQLFLDKIDITKLMYKELLQFLDNETINILNDYKIEKEKDLNNELKINFNYFLLKYIFKNIYDINQFKYVKTLRKQLKIMVKSNPNIFNNIMTNKLLK